jgi:peptidoglycan/xylan/chitin deacetylase (PgdA/CDA1 family)
MPQPSVVRLAAFAALVAGLLLVAPAAGAAVGSSSPRSLAIVVVRDSPPADVTPPVTTVNGAGDAWHRQAVVLTFSATDGDGSGVAFTEYRVDGRAWKQGTELRVAAPADHANDGVHTIGFRSVDLAGNVEPEQTCTVKIDTRAPGFRWVGLAPSTLYRIAPVRLRFRTWDRTDVVHVTLTVFDAGGDKVTARPRFTVHNGRARTAWSLRYGNRQPVIPGLYRLRLTLVDAAGNRRVSSLRALRCLRPVRTTVWRHIPHCGRRVALTFDDGGSPWAWARILAVLRAHHVKASFFILGPYVAADRALAQRTVAQGETIGDHTWTHSITSMLSYGSLLGELRRDQGAWWSRAGATPVPYFRPPYGDYNGTDLAAAGAAGYLRTILWDVDPRDWSEPGVGVIVSRVVSAARPGSIVVMHVRTQTALALPAIIRGLQARHLRPSSLDEMFRAAGYR